jgi:hypothetical protein
VQSLAVRCAAAAGAIAALFTSSRAEACWEVSDVVGYRRCASFGDGWDAHYAGHSPPLVLFAFNPFTRHSYRPGELLVPDDAARGARRVGCLDVRAEWATDRHVPAGSAVVAFSFGNACTSRTRVVFANLHVTARRADGSEALLTMYDPASEVHPAVLDGLDHGREVFEFDPPHRGDPSPESLCVDVSRLSSDPNDVAGEHTWNVAPICLQRAAPVADEHEVIGHNWTFPFGTRWNDWGFFFFVEMGPFMQTLDLGQSTFSAINAAQQDLHFKGSPFGRVTAYGVDTRFGLRFAGPVYGALFYRFGGGGLPMHPPIAVGGTVVRPDDSFFDIAAGGALGVVSSHSSGVRFRFELAGGVRGDFVDVAPPNCAINASDRTCSASTAAPLVEPRIALDVWFNPWWSLSSWVADDAIHPLDPALGLSFGFHMRGFDGAP